MPEVRPHPGPLPRGEGKADQCFDPSNNFGMHPLPHSLSLFPLRAGHFELKSPPPKTVRKPMSSKVPADLKFVKSHEWLRIEGDIATIGITDHAQQELTDIVFVELPAVGRTLKAGETCAVVESVKTASDIYSPVSGDIVEVNKAVAENPALTNTDPYGAGWFFKIKMAAPAEATALLSSAQYSQQIGQ